MLTELPLGWRWTRIGSHFNRVRRRNGADVSRVLTASGEHGLIDQEDFFKKRVAARDVSKYYHLKRGEFAYNRSAMSGYPCGAIKRLDRYSEGVLSTLYICFALKRDSGILSDFAAHLFESGLLDDELRGIVSVGARAHGLLNISPNDFLELSFPLPPLIEQRKIAEILSSVDEAIQSTQAAIEQTRRVKEGLLQDLLTKGVGHRRYKITEIGQIPESWNLARLGDVVEEVLAGKSPAVSDEPAGDNEWGVLKVSAIGSGQFFPKRNKVLPPDFHISNTDRVKPGDVLITRANTAELVGAVCRVPDGEYRLMLSDKTLRLVPNRQQITPGYLTEVAARPFARRYFAQRATGSSASMKNLSQGKIKSLPVPIPPLDEQRQIETILNEVRHAIEFQFSTMSRLERTKAGLLQDLLTGKVRVKI